MDGWVENDGTNEILWDPEAGDFQPTEDYYYEKQQAFRFAFAWDIGEDLTIDYSFDDSLTKSTGPYYQTSVDDERSESTSLTTDYVTGAKIDWAWVLPLSRTDITGHTLQVNYQINENNALKYIVGDREIDDQVYQNYSETIFFANDIDFMTESTSHELQWIGNAMNGQLKYHRWLVLLRRRRQKS